MFSNALRTQARLALTSCRARASIVSIAQLVPRAPLLSFSITRPLSTSRPVTNDYETVGYARERPVREANPPSENLFVGNLPFAVEESELRALFEPFGEVASIRIGELFILNFLYPC